MTQEWTVGVIVLAAAAYAVWYWLPAGLRRRLGRVHPALAEKRACGACNDCGGCADKSAGTAAEVAQPVRCLPVPADRHHPD